MERPYELDWTPDGMVARVRLRGHGVLAAPLLNRGTAFTPDEREELGLTGLLPDAVSTMEGQLARAYGQYLRQPDDLSRNLYLANLRDRNEVLFYRLLTEHIEEMLPIVYTPTIGTAIERYSYEFGRPRGVYLSVDHPDQVETAFRNYGLGPDGRGSGRGHRCGGHLGHRRLGSGRHRDRGRQAGRLRRSGGIAPGPGHPGGAGHRDRQPRAARS